MVLRAVVVAKALSLSGLPVTAEGTPIHVTVTATQTAYLLYRYLVQHKEATNLGISKNVLPL